MTKSELKSIGVIELVNDETKAINGGLILEMLAAAYLGVVIYEVMDNPKRVWNGIVDSLT